MPATGVCPRMSDASRIVTCKGEKCHWWNSEFEMCSEVLKVKKLDGILICLVRLSLALTDILAGGGTDEA